jgi:hypothetical protein
MSGTQEFLFGIIFCGAITALIVMVAVVRGRLENHESKTEVKEWSQETIQRAS